MDIGAVSLWPSPTIPFRAICFFGSNPGTHRVQWRKPPYFFFMLLKSGDKHHLLHFETLSNPSYCSWFRNPKKNSVFFWFFGAWRKKTSGFPCDMFCIVLLQSSTGAPPPPISFNHRQVIHFIGGGLDGSPSSSSTSTSHRMGKSHTFNVHQLFFVGTLNKNVSKFNVAFLMPISFRFLISLAIAAMTCFGVSIQQQVLSGGSLMLTAMSSPRFFNDVGG